jgi:DNA-binding protein HU-beta
MHVESSIQLLHDSGSTNASFVDSGSTRVLAFETFFPQEFTRFVAARATVTAIDCAARTRGDVMAEARRMGKSELFSHFAEKFEVKRAQAREYFDELTTLAEKELKRSGEFVLPGMVKLVVQKRKARMGRNPATGEAIKIPAKTVVKARIAKQLKDTVLPKK